VSLTVDNGEGGTDVASIVIIVTDEPVASDLSILYKDGGRGNASDNMINPHLQIANNGNEAVSYSDLSIRYWFSSEGNSDLNFWCDWAQLGSSNVVGTFGQLSGVDYLEITFNPGSGSLSSDSNSGDIQGRFAKSNWSPFDELDDHSYNGTVFAYEPQDKITLYKNGILVWGVEPIISLKSALKVEKETVLTVFPNPVRAKAILNSTTSLNRAIIKIIDARGSVFYERELKNNLKAVALDFSSLQSGVYFIHIENDNMKYVKQIVK